MAVYKHLKLSEHKHTGRLRPHEHTSYIPLALMVLFTGVVLALFTVESFAEAAHPGPDYGSVGLTGVMPAKPPTTAAVINSPTSGQHFSSSPVTVSGTCPTGTIVEVYKNDIFAGSSPCESNGTFSIIADLLIGPNTLLARVYDSLNQAGPDSATVDVFYDVLPPQTTPISLLTFSDRQMLLDTDAVYRGTFPGQTLNMPITILGGYPAFAINVEWGDSTNTVISRGDNVTFNASHVYQKPGTYQITVQASDSHQHVAFLQVAAIINGQPTVVGSTANTKPESNTLIVLWPLLAILATMVISFWIGEQREKRILLAQGKVPQLAS